MFNDLQITMPILIFERSQKQIVVISTNMLQCTSCKHRFAIGKRKSKFQIILIAFAESLPSFKLQVYYDKTLYEKLVICCARNPFKERAVNSIMQFCLYAVSNLHSFSAGIEGRLKHSYIEKELRTFIHVSIWQQQTMLTMIIAVICMSVEATKHERSKE